MFSTNDGSVSLVFGATVCKTVRPILSDRCLSVLSVCNVGVLWPNGWMDRDETWRVGRPRPWPHWVRWGPTSPSPKGAHPQFWAHMLWPNGWMDQDATWYGGRPKRGRSQVDVLLKRINAGKRRQRHTIAQILGFSDAKDRGKTQSGSCTPSGGAKCRWSRLKLATFHK